MPVGTTSRYRYGSSCGNPVSRVSLSRKSNGDSGWCQHDVRQRRECCWIHLRDRGYAQRSLATHATAADTVARRTMIRERKAAADDDSSRSAVLRHRNIEMEYVFARTQLCVEFNSR